MKITIKDKENNTLTFNEVEYRAFLDIFELVKREQYTIIIEPIDAWD